MSVICESVVSRVYLFDHAAGLDHAPRRDEVPLDTPDEVEPADADQTDREEQPEPPVEECAQRPREPVVRHRLREHEEHDPDRDRADEPTARLEEREPVALPCEQHAFLGREQRGVLRGQILGRPGPRSSALDRLGHQRLRAPSRQPMRCDRPRRDGTNRRSELQDGAGARVARHRRSSSSSRDEIDASRQLDGDTAETAVHDRPI
jgi:hypothetical protein